MTPARIEEIAMYQRKEEPSLGELFADLSREMTSLVRQEVRLATTELSTKASQMGRDAALIAAGGAIAYAGFLGIVAAIILALANFIPWWVSALIVGLVVAGAGFVLIQKGMNGLKEADLAPHQTIRSLKEDVAWAKNQTK